MSNDEKKEFQIYMYFSACEQQNTHQFVVCVCQQQFRNNKLLIQILKTQVHKFSLISFYSFSEQIHLYHPITPHHSQISWKSKQNKYS